MRLIRARYAGKCSQCHKRHPVGTMVYWERGSKGVLCRDCGRPTPKPATPAETPALPTPKPIHHKGEEDFVIDWTDLKQFVQSVLKADSAPAKFHTYNRDILTRNLLKPSDWNGYTRGQLDRWLEEGFSTDAIKGLTEFTPAIREKRKLVFQEEGDEFHLDLAYSGVDSHFSTWTKRETIPGIALEAVVTFSSATDAEIVNAYNVWLCRTIYSLESAGVDCEVTLNARCTNLIQGLPSNRMTNTRIRVKRENEVTDFVAISPVLSPAAFRTFLFAAMTLNSESHGVDSVSGLGRPETESRWGVYYDAEKRRIVTTAHAHGSKHFPAEEMTRQFREALKDAMKGSQK
jgi:hypothetical protein